MQTRILKSWPIWLLLLAVGNALGENHIVTVGNGEGTFEPKHLTILAGDTVTFIEAGASEPHNVEAVDGSFRCAQGCDGDGHGGNGNASLQDWSDTLTFSKPGFIPYYCEPHRMLGMVGDITINATPSVTIGGYMSGNWYNPQQGGSGFQIEAATNNNMLVIWFVYSPDGTAQNWIYAQGDYDPTSNTVTLPAELLTGAKFPPNFNPADVHKLNDANWGTLMFTFSDCNTGTVSWHSDFAGYNNQNDTPMAITRLTQIDGTTCP